VDPEDAPVLQQAAWEALGSTSTRIILDLEICSHITTPGVAVLFSLANWARAKQGTVIAFRPSSHLLRLLQLVQLTSEPGFQVFTGLDDAGLVLLGEAAPTGAS
jgi:ABC-type transporter Mla MlaB component